ncbi:hypothetical protein H0E84_05920 [Luteimonas sp. SJ-92]|uniref:Reverse transcriptase domain-containing protein n=2 Tax=Luteimonas salinisoli TaxID=2752307 RepID=A0A853JAP8_9GAMM|nr:hypothetical protein [Luteimonas salinisoli]
MRRWHSQAHLQTKLSTRPTGPAEWNQFLDEIEAAIATDSFKFSGLRWHTIRGRQTLSTDLLEDTLVIRKINDNIRRSYGITQPNRASLIRTAKQAIRENTPKTIVRLDLKSCFESINRNLLIKQLRAEAKVSSQTMALLEGVFRGAAIKFPGRMPEGIPRGLTISTSLAELKLRELDSCLRMLPGTYLVLRYVDDILVFTTETKKSAWAGVNDALRNFAFKRNLRKSYPIRVSCSCDDHCPHGSDCPCNKKCTCLARVTERHEMEYLGYKIIFDKHNASAKKDPNAVFSILSEAKSSKIKTRIALAAQECQRTHDWIQFEKRIAYLTSNQRVAVTPGKRGLFNGLSYTHSEYEAPPQYAGKGTIEDLDKFYRTTLRRLLTRIAVKPHNQAKLESLSFDSGFRHHRRVKFTPLDVLNIKKCWEK